MEASEFQYENYLNIHGMDDFGTSQHCLFSLRFLEYDHLTENCLIMSIKNKVWISGHLSRYFSKGTDITELVTST